MDKRLRQMLDRKKKVDKAIESECEVNLDETEE